MDKKLMRLGAIVGAAILLAAAVMVYFFVYAAPAQPVIGEVITPEPTAVETPEPEHTAEAKPSETVTAEETPAPTAEPEPSATPECDYVLNKNSMKIHYPWCRGVADMKESNKIYFTGTIDEAKAEGYTSCGTCKPE